MSRRFMFLTAVTLVSFSRRRGGGLASVARTAAHGGFHGDRSAQEWPAGGRSCCGA
jgi:hypothetical protein